MKKLCVLVSLVFAADSFSGPTEEETSTEDSKGKSLTPGKAGNPFWHSHCKTHTHTHERGTAWHDRYVSMGSRWESIRLYSGPYARRSTWGIDDNLPKRDNRKNTHTHCMYHTHSHINAAHYHMKDGLWYSVRLED